MLHHINPPTSESTLHCVLDFMERLLIFACNHDPITTSDLEMGFGVVITNWLNQNHLNVLDNLKVFARRTVTDKQSILASFNHDRGFTSHWTDPAFRFRLNNPPSNDPVKVWLVKFYDQLKSSGFHPLVCNHYDFFRYDDWWNSFFVANPTQTMCVVCDGTMNHGRTIEHYFPRSLYPVLSIHPANLIPLCDKCNNDKSNTDPLDNITIDQIFIPYRDTVDQVVDLDFCPLPGGREEIRFRPIVTDPTLPTKLSKYSQLFSLPEQWNKNIHEISNIGVSTLRQQLRGMRRAGALIGRPEFSQLIDDVCIDMEQDWGRAHYFYPASKWLQWAKQHKFDTLCTELGVV